MKKIGEDEYLCLSFNNYGLSLDIAAKLSDEFQGEENHREEDFEFSLVCENSDKSIAEFIYEGQIKFQQPVFPLFNRDLLLSNSDLMDKSILIPWKKLFLEKNEPTSSSGADELKKIPAGTYCIWKPEISEPLPGKCKKSKSTGFVSKRWLRIRDSLWQSSSEGKEEGIFVFLTRKAKSKSSSEVVKTTGKVKQTKTSGGEKGSPAATSEQTLYYAGNREGDKNRRESYLPYRKELIAFFAIGLNKSYRPF